MATKGDAHNIFLVMNAGAVDLASHGAVASVDTAIDVEALDGVDQAPLIAGRDHVLAVIWPITFTAGIAYQTAVVTDSNTITIRTTNASAGAVDPASIAANLIYFVVARR